MAISAAAARDLQKAVNAFLAHPDTQTLSEARKAWKAARVPYLQSEGLPLRQHRRRRLGAEGQCLAAGTRG